MPWGRGTPDVGSPRLFYWVANWNLSRAMAARLLGGHVDDMGDGTSAAVGALRSSSLRKIAGYVTGTDGIAWTASDWASIGNARALVRIDQAPGDTPVAAEVKRATVADTEPGADTPAGAIAVAAYYLARGQDFTIYVDQAELAQVEDRAAAAGLPHGEIVAYQWASPTTNPDTLLPGTRLTLREANVDLSVTLPDWHPIPHPMVAGHAPASPRRFAAEIELDPNNGEWRIAPLPFNARPLG